MTFTKESKLELTKKRKTKKVRRTSLLKQKIKELNET